MSAAKKAPVPLPAGLTVDPAKEGNFFCPTCNKSITAAKGEAHLVSATHKNKAAGGTAAAAAVAEPAAAPKAKKTARGPKPAADGSDAKTAAAPAKTAAAPAKTAAAPAKSAKKRETKSITADAPATTGTLPADPAKAGNVWCGICKQSLPPSREATHLATAKHAAAADAALAAALQSTKI